jgi:hypothetical protein
MSRPTLGRRQWLTGLGAAAAGAPAPDGCVITWTLALGEHVVSGKSWVCMRRDDEADEVFRRRILANMEAA